MFRFALSPTGDMHLGNLQVALFNYICAQQAKEKFLIRIDDTDKEHNLEGKDQETLEILHLFGISYDQIIYQSENLKFHRQLATKLLMDKNAFACFCTPEIIEQKKEAAKEAKEPYYYDQTCKYLSDAEVIDNEAPFVVRIKKPQKEITFQDLIQGELSFSPDTIDDFMIMYIDKTPTHNFASAIDDMMYDISTIVCEKNKLPDTPKEILIRNYLGYDKQISYAHLPTLVNNTGKKINEHDKTFNVKSLLEEGYLPQAITNYLILITNTPPTEIFTLQEAVEWFSLENIAKTHIKFDLDKLRQINREHIKQLPLKELSTRIGYSSEDIGALAKLYAKKVSTLGEIKSKIDKIFGTKKCNEFPKNFAKLKEIAKEAPYSKTFEEYKAYLSQESHLKGEELLKPLRVMLTGEKHGPDLSAIYSHIKNYLGEIIK